MTLRMPERTKGLLGILRPRFENYWTGWFFLCLLHPGEKVTIEPLIFVFFFCYCCFFKIFFFNFLNKFLFSKQEEEGKV